MHVTNSGANISSQTRVSSAYKANHEPSHIDQITALQEAILKKAKEKQARKHVSAKNPSSVSLSTSLGQVRTIDGLELNNRQINAYKWLMLAIAEDLCPGFQVIPEQREALNQIFCYSMGIPTDTIDPERGLWIWGAVGTGKSTLLKLVREFAHRVRSSIARDYTFRITTAAHIAGVYTDKGYAGLLTYVDNRFQAIDDLGNEPRHLKFYGSDGEPLAYIITTRYGQRRENDFTHVTTNLTMGEVVHRYGFRTADRIHEMFNVIHLPGTSFRGHS